MKKRGASTEKEQLVTYAETQESVCPRDPVWRKNPGGGSDQRCQKLMMALEGLGLALARWEGIDNCMAISVELERIFPLAVLTFG